MPPKKKGNRNNKKTSDTIKRDLVLKQENEDYAKVQKLVGDRRLKMLTSTDGKEIIGTIRGCFGKRCWIKEGDLVLIQYREYQLDKADVIYKYTNDEENTLFRQGEIPQFFLGRNNDYEHEQKDENVFFFDEDSERDNDFEDKGMQDPSRNLPEIDQEEYYNPLADRF